MGGYWEGERKQNPTATFCNLIGEQEGFVNTDRFVDLVVRR